MRFDSVCPAGAQVERFVSLAENPFEKTPTPTGPDATLSVTLDPGPTVRGAAADIQWLPLCTRKNG